MYSVTIRKQGASRWYYFTTTPAGGITGHAKTQWDCEQLAIQHIPSGKEYDLTIDGANRGQQVKP